MVASLARRLICFFTASYAEHRLYLPVVQCCQLNFVPFLQTWLQNFLKHLKITFYVPIENYVSNGTCLINFDM